MVSQLLLGEAGEVLESAKDFTRIRCLHDGYEGWIQSGQVVVADELPPGFNDALYTCDWTSKILINDALANISMGTPVPSATNTGLQIGPYHIQYGSINTRKASGEIPDASFVTEMAFRLLNTSYVWGGRSVFGTDCSGFTQLVYRFFKISLPRDAYLQARQGEAIGFLQEVKCGDLAFFDNAEGKIIHVGILLNDHEIIHAAGKVRVDRIDNEGIFNRDINQRTHRLRVIRRYF